MSDEYSTEEWRDIPGFEGYQVSDQGRVRTFLRRGNCTVRMGTEPRILKRHILPNGYHHLALYTGKGVHRRYVHRLVLEAFVGPPPPGMVSRHILNNNRSDNRLVNLCWGTVSENIYDRVRHGTHQRGSRMSCTRLTETKVILMRLLYAGGMSLAQLSPLFSQRRENIFKIVKRKTWTHI